MNWLNDIAMMSLELAQCCFKIMVIFGTSLIFWNLTEVLCSCSSSMCMASKECESQRNYITYLNVCFKETIIYFLVTFHLCLTKKFQIALLWYSLSYSVWFRMRSCSFKMISRAIFHSCWAELFQCDRVLKGFHRGQDHLTRFLKRSLKGVIYLISRGWSWVMGY